MCHQITVEWRQSAAYRTQRSPQIKKGHFPISAQSSVCESEPDQTGLYYYPPPPNNPTQEVSQEIYDFLVDVSQLGVSSHSSPDRKTTCQSDNNHVHPPSFQDSTLPPHDRPTVTPPFLQFALVCFIWRSSAHFINIITTVSCLLTVLLECSWNRSGPQQVIRRWPGKLLS